MSSAKEKLAEIRERHADDLAVLAKNPAVVEHWPDSWQTPADIATLLAIIDELQLEVDGWRMGEPGTPETVSITTEQPV